MTDIVHSRLMHAVRVCKQFTKSCNINVANSVYRDEFIPTLNLVSKEEKDLYSTAVY